MDLKLSFTSLEQKKKNATVRNRGGYIINMECNIEGFQYLKSIILRARAKSSEHHHCLKLYRRIAVYERNTFI